MTATADLPRATVRRTIPVEAADDLVGTRVAEHKPSTELRNPGLWTDADTGEPVLGLLPCQELSALRQTILSVDKMSMTGVYRSGTGNRNLSATFGYRPRKPAMSQEGCVLTAFNRDFPNEAAFLAHYADVLTTQLGEAFPEIEIMGRDVVEQVLPDWRLSDHSLWTSGVINKESALPYHRDGNNFDAWSVMPVVRSGVRGGHLHIPEYDLVVPCRDGIAVAFFGKRLVHGVTPMRKIRNDAYRISVVYYALRGLKDCHTFAEETAYAARKRADREDKMAARGTTPDEDRFLKGKRPSGLSRVNPDIRHGNVLEQ